MKSSKNPASKKAADGASSKPPESMNPAEVNDINIEMTGLQDVTNKELVQEEEVKVHAAEEDKWAQLTKQQMEVRGVEPKLQPG
mmetsp:Transcript_18733/g.28746  ORF Transcript_18733/g.28746 Transcript_18733/m.28746 type:complete len:84 (+) Transcript_18733:1626-1877(+)|eukprot:CAMPEP_0170497794 /NCGR_PEP_ID=MMETSP0208-20121228/25817_1 /TAXON_ID=197538 /ORGANISM="Strombidium inclinatum, Strain S3" /LENGTH=83 /DNA_ID=CAMNT_0010774729 /DNA_START=1533 /DNA_END=1784 /DNA_ORIENTATION=-